MILRCTVCRQGFVPLKRGEKKCSRCSDHKPPLSRLVDGRPRESEERKPKR